MISIITPCYNVEKYFEKYIDSVQCQSMEDWELILIDDGSTDKTGAICDRYSSLDDRIKVIHKSNQGVSAARNDGLKACKGEYIVFFDADDWIDKDFLSTLMESLMESGADVAACDTYYVTQDKNGVLIQEQSYKWGKISKPIVVTGKELYYAFLYQSATLWNKLFKREVLMDALFNTDMSYGEDTDYLLQAMRRIKSAILLPYCGYFYFFNRSGNVRSSLDDRSIELLHNATKFYKMLRQANMNSLGVYRIYTTLQKVVLRVHEGDQKDPKRKEYYRECKKAARFPSLPDKIRFVFDGYFSIKMRVKYLVSMSFPALLVNPIKQAKGK